MPKYEEKPGVYSRKKPRPVVDRKTSKVLLNQSEISPERLEDLQARATRDLNREWEDGRPVDRSTILNCDQCMAALTELEWKYDNENGKLEPLFDRCSSHTNLIEDWVFELLELMIDKLDRSGEE